MGNFDYSQMTPEQLDALMELGVLDEQGGQLDAQMQQAQALQQASGHHYTTGLGAALGGLGDMFNQNSGMTQEASLREAQQRLTGSKLKGRKAYAQLLMSNGQQEPTAPPMPQASPFGYGGAQQQATPPPFGYAGARPFRGGF